MTARHEHRLTVEGGVATIVLDRPAAYNAVTRALVHALADTLREVERDDAVRAVILTGAGKGFCAGQALDDEAVLPPSGPADLYGAVVDGFNPVVHRLLTMEKPVVAAVNGVAAGAGMGFALACDFRIVAEGASFTTAFSKIGLVPDSGVSLLLPRMVGYARALELCLLSAKIDATRALDLGLATRVVPLEALPGEAAEFAGHLAAGPKAYGLIKRELVRNGLGAIGECLAYEAELQSIAGETGDFAEGLRAFRAKRVPHFTGR